MSDRERLTKQELSWLLTQEARGAAERLKQGVALLTKPPPPAPPASERLGSDRPPGSERPITLTVAGEEGEGLHATLQLLDGAMNKLAQLNLPSGRGRRGRVDVAALLWEMAPHAKVQLETGSGTEVYADDAELRRMLGVLLGAQTQSGVGGAQVVTLRREGDDVRLAVGLGPDTAPISQAERAWLSRMAIRFGGRYELDGASECLIFPAFEVQHRDEMQSLRRELEAAKAQGEMYARELAQVFAEPPPETVRPSTLAPPPLEPGVLGEVSTMARLAQAMADDLRAVLGPLGAARLRAAGGTDESIWQEVQDALARGADLLLVARQMARVADEPKVADVDLAALAREEAGHAALPFGARGVSLRLEIPSAASLVVSASPSACRVVIAELFDRALRGTRAGGAVRVAIEEELLLVEVVDGVAAEEARALREGRTAHAFLGELARAQRLRVMLEPPRARFGADPTRMLGA
jgi:two-component system OmpR family sensor kinase